MSQIDLPRRHHLDAITSERWTASDQNRWTPSVRYDRSGIVGIRSAGPPSRSSTKVLATSGAVRLLGRGFERLPAAIRDTRVGAVLAIYASGLPSPLLMPTHL